MSQGFNHKIMAAQMEICTLETIFQKKLKKIWNGILIAIVVIACISLSSVISGWIHLEQGHKQGVKDAYYEKNKIKKVKYAGAGGEGRVMKSEDKK